MSACAGNQECQENPDVQGEKSNVLSLLSLLGIHFLIQYPMVWALRASGYTLTNLRKLHSSLGGLSLLPVKVHETSPTYRFPCESVAKP